VAEVYAGFICGYACALALTPLVAISLLRLSTTNATLGRLLPPGTSAVGLSVILHIGVAMGATAAGLLLGIVLKAMDSGRQMHFLLSRNAAFTVLVLGLVIALVAPVFMVLPRVRGAVLAGAFVTVLVFGWLMPFLASKAHFG
jgi:hypothetical protein